MLMAMTDTEKAEYEGIIRLLTTKLEEVAAENTRLRSEKSDALSVCQLIYSDPDAPLAIRIKAAGLALPHETPRLTPVPPPLDLSAEEIVEPLAVVVERQRARQNALQGRDIEVSPSGTVRVLSHKPGPNGGNGSDEH
jgi:hypothetical protein